MNKRAQQSVTSLPRSAQDDRRSRMVKYSVAMGIRMVCILALLFVHGWWLLVAGIGAVVLPYIAVVIANVSSRPTAHVAVPQTDTPLALLPTQPSGGTHQQGTSAGAGR